MATPPNQVPPTGEASVNRVAMRVPPFWPERPALWFSQLEVQFSLAGITSELTKFSHVVAQLDNRHAVEVEDIIVNPPSESPYKRITEELISRLSTSQETRIRQLLEHEELGDRKPSQFLRHIRSLAGNSVPDDFVRTLWVNRLPSSAQAILATQDSTDLAGLAKLADKVCEVTSQPQVASAEAYSEMAELRKQMAELTRQVAALSTQRYRARSRSKSRPRHRSPSGNRDPRFCYYHGKFGAAAHKCRPPCAYVAENPKSSG
ncbi:uncharacterized protein LOC124165850 [Ischnura elegans]|uniref:uncharacterized protein LOC124165850 n=1 Tax=Ischnura elegans TaxID=197161 RepID=UPI001ED8B565|nr:uncharacterized protein LOC124165850 [Ischnura elegans]